MRDRRLSLFLLSGLLLTPMVSAYDRSVEPAGSVVAVSVEVDGRPAPLYPAPDGSERRYLEARQGSSYAIHLDNRTGERVGVVLTVDGLNVISGQQATPSAWAPSGRMYVLDPWESTVVSGWRTSLSEIRHFTFVDEHASYAERVGKANSKMGWIETAVYRERHLAVRQPVPLPRVRSEARRDAPSEEATANATAPNAPAGSAADDRAAAKSASRDAESGYPGTGWGNRDVDPVQVVSFDPEPRAAQTVTLRYEYARGLQALGILPRSDWGRDRLHARDRGDRGFVPTPAW